MDKNKISQIIISYFSKKEEVTVVYLFGSVISGNSHKFSDIDVAVLLRDVPENCLEYRLNLITELSKLLEFDRVDVVILNDAPPRLKFEVIQNGEDVFVKDEDERCDFEVRARQEYFDIQPLLDLQYEYMRKRLKEGKFGAKLV